MNALERLRVVEVGGEIAAPYATKLLADLGADVVKVEPPTGDPLRSWTPFPDTAGRPGLLFRYLNGGKRSCAVDLDTDAGAAWLRATLTGADILVESLGAGCLEALGVDLNPPPDRRSALAVVRLAPYGQTGPYVGRPTSGLVLQALGGWVSSHGVPGIDPVQVGARLHEYAAGTYAAAAALTALRAARHTQTTTVVDLSVVECLVGTLAYPNLVLEDMLNAGLTPPQARHFPLPGIVRCRDGWVGINALTGQHFIDACTMFELDEFGPRQAELAEGGALLDEFYARLEPWLQARDAAEIVELSQAFRVPAAPVGDGRMMLDYAQFRERPFFVTDEDLTLPGPPYRLSATPARRPGPAPALGQRGTAPRPRPGSPAVASPRSANGALPFSGLRVVDLGTFWAGPYCTMYLGALGAEVIKVESVRRPDGFRFSGANPAMGADWYERSGVFAGTNLNKRDVTLDLTTEPGRALLRQLIQRADIVLENFSARVVEHFELGYDQARAINPNVIMVRMPGFGLVGPWRDYVGWAMVIEQATGMASVTGPPERPMHPGGPADPIIGMHAAVAVQAALEHRAHHGEGQLIEVAQLETGANLTAELVVEWSAQQHALPRAGNRDPHAAPQGVYPCLPGVLGPEWVALTVAGDDQWAPFASVVADAGWPHDRDLRTAAGRRVRHDELDDVIGAWTRRHRVDDVVAQLTAEGIPAARVLTVPRMFEDPQLTARGYYVELDHARTGRRRYPGWPMRFSFSPAQHRTGAPTMGQHNDEILAELGVSGPDRARLAREGIIGDRLPDA
ncbi:MAG TPA: CoA transferase [Acidimicrobiia bacterium]|nr:CoA transferase [Acidimicrobiia bacterium]